MVQSAVEEYGGGVRLESACGSVRWRVLFEIVIRVLPWGKNCKQVLNIASLPSAGRYLGNLTPCMIQLRQTTEIVNQNA